ncbi:MAG: dihydrodipicolinate synthase family protein [Candidatus Aminicenantes bacterium]|nr:dihydrodipicolinate synthase family protein [Candidatus Aminicenantes bacterium]
MAKKFRGIYAALLTPFVGDEIATDQFRDNILKFNEQDLAGYVVLGSTGECVSISDEESERLVRTAREAAAKGKTIIAGTARESTRLTIDFTNRMADLGVDAALVRPPSYFKAKMTKEALKKHFLAVADRSRVPIIVYNIPQNTGLSLEAQLILELSEHPNIVGLKESSGTISFLGELIRRLPADFSYLLGHGSAFLPALLMGASGAILAVANAAPALCAKTFRLFNEGKIGEAATLQLDLVPLNKAVMESYGIAGLKYALDRQGWYGGPVRLPLLPMEEKGQAEIDALLKKLGLIG